MKKVFTLCLALLLTAALQFYPGLRLSVGGLPLDGCFSLRSALRGVLAARAAADELLPGEATLPRIRAAAVLSRHPPSQETSPVSAALLEQTEGIAVREGCFVNGIYLCCALDGERLRQELRRQIYANRPEGAVSGRYVEEVAVRQVYTRPGRELSPQDAGLLVSGMTPVMYTDREGKVVV